MMGCNMNWVGAKWWKFDLHTHTPASFDYGKGDQSVKNITPRDWLLHFINHKISCVAVTDHNTGACIDPLQSAAQQLRSEGHEIYVFPGVEITANSSIHILGIFDPSSSSAIIESIIGIAGFRGTTRSQNNSIWL
jgi:predicted metal-dependent phosphoesterase TrpH